MQFFNQSEQLENFQNRNKKGKKTKMAKLISITSGKGGVGKSNFILNLAIAMSIRGKKILLIDADMNLSNLDILIGVYPQFTLKNLIDDLISVNDLLIDGPKGIKILPASSGDISIMKNTKKAQQALIQAYTELKPEYDYILIDTGAGISDYTMDFVLSSEKIVIITTPEPTAITDAYAMIKMLFYHHKSPDISMVINMVQTDEEGKNIFNKINMIVQHFLNKQVKHIGNVPFDKYLPEAVREQVPILLKRPRSISSANIHNIAVSILREDKNKE